MRYGEIGHGEGGMRVREKIKEKNDKMEKETWGGVRIERGWNMGMKTGKKWKGRNGDGMEKKRGRWNGKREG